VCRFKSCLSYSLETKDLRQIAVSPFLFKCPEFYIEFYIFPNNSRYGRDVREIAPAIHTVPPAVLPFEGIPPAESQHPHVNSPPRRVAHSGRGSSMWIFRALAAARNAGFVLI
jgi:hypothetical protein